ncbi:MAG TPA: hypothetical protein VG389_16800 [Myxococcota bacterium]|nr:hypothetical protein [Myxococcota bacterium]
MSTPTGSYAVVLCTCAREHSYAPATIRSASAADPGGWSGAAHRLAIVDGHDGRYLGGTPRTAEMKVRTHKGEPLGAYGNVARALAAGAESGADAVVLLEDDLELAPGWLTALARLGFSHVAPYFPRYFISGYVPYVLAPRPSCRWLADYDVPFYASCCLFLPRDVAADLAAALHRGAGQADHEPADLTIARAAKDLGLRIFATVPSVAQHVGDASTLGATEVRRSPTFGSLDVP